MAIVQHTSIIMTETMLFIVYTIV